MIKKIFIFGILALLMLSGVMAAGEASDNGQGDGVQTDTDTPQQNQGEETQIQTEAQIRVRTGEYVSEDGQQMRIQEQTNNRLQIQAGNVSAYTSMTMNQEQVQNRTKLSVELSNGRNAEIKTMPDTASERALERLRLKVCSTENNCQIELKEVGTGEQARAAYEVKAQKQAKVLGMFRTRMQVSAQISAENGEILQTRKPWWAFLAVESEE